MYGEEPEYLRGGEGGLRGAGSASHDQEGKKDKKQRKSVDQTGHISPIRRKDSFAKRDRSVKDDM